jgi:hypothetical protein
LLANHQKNLDTAVVGLDDAVGGAALAGHVAEREVMLVVLVLLEGLRDEPSVIGDCED